MKAKLTLSFLFVIFAASIKAYVYRDTIFYRKNPEFIEFERDSGKTYDAYILHDNRKIYYTKENRRVTRHKIVHIENKESIDDFNKIYIYIPFGGSIDNIQARTIKKDGTIINLNEKNIKELPALENDASMKIFAIEGAEAGCQIEYSYTLEMPTFDTGIEFLDEDYPVKNSFTIVMGNAFFTIHSKGYNADFKTKSIDEGDTYTAKNLYPVPDEEYSSKNASSPRIMYGIKSNPYGDLIFANYGYASTYLYTKLRDTDATQKRKIWGLIKQYGKAPKDEKTLNQLHNTLKRNFFYVENYDDKYEDILTILKTGKANDVGMTKIFILALEMLDYRFEILVTCDKYQFSFDKDFCSRYYMTEYLIFLPKFDKYIYPSIANSQLGIVPSYLDGNHALVLNGSRLEKFREIKASSSKTDNVTLDIYVKLNIEEGTSSISLTESGIGYVAYAHNADMYYSSDADERNRVITDNLAWRYPDCEIISYDWINKSAWGNLDSCHDYECKRSYIAELKSGTLYDRIGDKLILNVGTLIGPQNELYSKEDRKLPIVNGYNKSYKFNITIEIPDGYKFVSYQNLKIENTFTDSKSDDVLCGFKSSYKIDGNKIHIDIYEFYDSINIDKLDYEDFKKVINSAADFNKAAILFEKIK